MPGTPSRRTEGSGRRTTDLPMVSWRDYLETLIRGVRTELHLEVTTIAQKLDEQKAQQAVQHSESTKAIGELTGAIKDLQSDRALREGEERASRRIWTRMLTAAGAGAALTGAVVAIVNLAT